MSGPLHSQTVRRALIAALGVVMCGATATVLSQNAAQGRRAGPPVAAAEPTRASLVDLMLQLESLQRELRELRGRIEVQNHELDRLRQRDRDLLADFDRRLRELERRGTTTVPYTPPGAAAGGTPAPMTPPAPTSPRAPAAPAAPLPAAAQEQQDYDAAFNLLKQGYYERAAKSFSEFIQKYPRSGLADNAQYWVGEASYVVRNFRVALDEFQKVLTKYPSSPKISDALLKMGYCYYELGAFDKARETLTQVMTRFPNTTVAKSAEIRLAKMEKEGH